MPQQTQLYIVASRHPRVGKTLLARLLVEFLPISGRPLVGYDLDPREPTLAGCFPSLVWPIDIADTPGQMALFDRILADHWRTTVIDLGYGLSDQFFKVMAQIGFEDEAREKSIQPIVLFITDSAPITAENYAELRRRLGGTVSFRCTMKRRRSWSSRRTSRRHRPNSRPSTCRASPRSCAALSIGRAFRFPDIWRSSPAGRPRCIAGSIRFSRNFASLNCSS